MTLPVPNQQSAIVSAKGPNGIEIAKGYLIPPWNSWFQQFSQKAPSVSAVVLGVSPFSYKANENGNLIISGGTVSAISLIRGIITIPLSTTRPLIVPISIGDIVIVTYTVLPTLQFLGA